MSTSYKIALGIAAVLALLVIVYVVTQNDGDTEPADGPTVADQDRTPQPRPTLRSDTDRTTGSRTPTASRTPNPPTNDTPNSGLGTPGAADDDRSNDDDAPAQVTLGQPRTAPDGSTGANEDLMARIRAGTRRAAQNTDDRADQAPDNVSAADPTTGTDPLAPPTSDDGSIDAPTSPGNAPWDTHAASADTDPSPTTSSSTQAVNSTTTSPRPTPSSTDDARDDTPSTYTVEAGDNMFRISEKVFGSDRYWQAIAQANPTIDPTRLRIGQELRMPDREDIVEDEIDDIDAPANTVIHTVGAGETLSSIAQRYYGDPTEWNLIYNANRDRIGANPDRLKAGMKLQVPPALPR